MAEVSVPLKESQGVLVHTRPQPKLIDRVVLAPGRHCKQKLDGRVVVGGQVVAGVGTADGEVADPGENGQRILREAAGVLPGVRGVAVERVTVGYRVMPVDEYPVVGFTDRCPNLYVAAMHSGVTLAPLIGNWRRLRFWTALESVCWMLTGRCDLPTKASASARVPTRHAEACATSLLQATS